MKISDKGLSIIKKYEGCHLVSYRCPAGVWTIGYGHTSGVVQGMKITQAQADAFLRKDLERFEKLVEKYHGTYKWNQNEFDALVSFAYNIGSIDQLTANGTRSREVIADKIPEYVKAGGVILNGLVKRRKEEKALFIAGRETGGYMDATESQKGILKQGMQSREVKDLQEKLSVIGYDPGSADGIFGAKTKAALKEFQKDAGISADGIAGEKTFAALDEIKIYSKLLNGSHSITNNFKAKEFACKDGSDNIVLHNSFVVEKLQKIRSHFGQPVTINSAYRTSSYNKKVGGASGSFHCKGRAFDIVVKGKSPAEVAKYAASIGIKGIIQYETFVHVDSRPTRYWAINRAGKSTAVSGF